MRKQILTTVLALSLSAATVTSVSAEPQVLPSQIAGHVTEQQWQQLTEEQQMQVTKSSSYLSPFMLVILFLSFFGIVLMPADSLASPASFR